MTDSTAASLAAEWLRLDRDPATRSEAEALVAAGDVAVLDSRMSNRMKFGTAGFRAAMGAGFSCMNTLTVIQAAQGLLRYLQQTLDAEMAAASAGARPGMTLLELAASKASAANVAGGGGIVIGYDGRYGSRRFAEATAAVFAAAGQPVRLFGKFVPTPFVPFALRKYRCAAGVMVTASHNPKADNGFKVYLGNGAQIVPPHDDNIALAIEESLEPTDAAWGDGWRAAIDPFDEVSVDFFTSLRADVACEVDAGAVAVAPVKFAYTAMHGVGTPFTRQAVVDVIGIPAANFVPVAAQCDPDPEFPTVVFPNPEEGAGALALAMETAEAAGATVILANDPDADRLAVAERLSGSTTKGAAGWRLFNGNEIGALLGWDAVRRVRATAPNAVAADAELKRCVMLSSAVSSSVLRRIAADCGAAFEQTLTGFKWMGSRAATLEAEGRRVIFAFEEAIGFMVGGRVWDKDGVTAAAALVQLASRLAASASGPRTLAAQLDCILTEFGDHASSNSYVIAPSPAVTLEAFERIRRLDSTPASTGGSRGTIPAGYPCEIAGARVLAVRDLQAMVDSTRADLAPTLPSAGPMITFWLDNGVELTVRGSGTEPKLKWYCEMTTPVKTGKKVDRTDLNKFVAAAVDTLLDIDAAGFKRRV